MTLNEFVKAFAYEFYETPSETITAETKYKELKEWDSLIALSIVVMIDEKLEKEIDSEDIRICENIRDFYNLVNSK